MTSMHVTGSFSIRKSKKCETFVTRKITRGFTRINAVLINVFILAILIHKEIGDMLEIMFICNGLCYNKMSQRFVIATGRMTSVRNFMELCAKNFGQK